MPIGYLITVAVVAVARSLALVPRDPPGPVRTASWALGSIVSESPFAAFYWILAATLLALARGDLDTPVGWVALGIAGATFLGTPPSGAPVLIHLHGGGFFMGRKSVYSRALLVELARHGWVCISASYRLRPRAVFPDYLVAAKEGDAWARRRGAGVRG